jgi:peptidoglycan/LPS O-acetylase OafA/YrhL
VASAAVYYPDLCFYTLPVLRKWGRFGDFSYGIYLYALPVQQLLIQFFRNDIALDAGLARHV